MKEKIDKALFQMNESKVSDERLEERFAKEKEMVWSLYESWGRWGSELPTSVEEIYAAQHDGGVAVETVGNLAP